MNLNVNAFLEMMHAFNFFRTITQNELKTDISLFLKIF
jgi:hypothetical protein